MISADVIGVMGRDSQIHGTRPMIPSFQGNQVIVAQSSLNCITWSQTDKSHLVLPGVIHMGRQHGSENDTLSG